LRNATVYIAGRSQEKGETAIAKLEEDTGNENVYFLKLDLADIPSVVSAAKELISKETRLDILLNNAYDISYFPKLIPSGVMTPEDGKTGQGYDLTWVSIPHKMD
jgi:retinol dehydrogenase 12